MNTETIIFIGSTILAVVKAISETRKAKYESVARVAEAQRADEAEKTTDAVIRGVEKAKRTMADTNLAQYLVDEIKNEATRDGVEGGLNKRVRHIKMTTKLDRSKLRDKLED